MLAGLLAFVLGLPLLGIAVLAVVLIVVAVCLEAEKTIGIEVVLGIILLAWVGLMIFNGDKFQPDWAAIQWVVLLRDVAVYLALGALYASLRWFIKLHESRNDYFAFLDALKNGEDRSKWSETYECCLQNEAVWNKDTEESSVRQVVRAPSWKAPRIRDEGSLVRCWIWFWPLSAVAWLLHKPVTWIYNSMVTMFSTYARYLQKGADEELAKVHDALTGKRSS